MLIVTSTGQIDLLRYALTVQAREFNATIAKARADGFEVDEEEEMDEDDEEDGEDGEDEEDEGISQ